MHRTTNNQNNSKQLLSPQIAEMRYNVVNYVFSSFEINKYRYELIQSDGELSRLLEKKYYISANFTGKNCLLVFLELNGKRQSFLIDRKTLTYDIKNIDYTKVFVQRVYVNVSNLIYSGSIFDGIYIKNTGDFVITDVFKFRNADFTAMNIDSKIFTVKEFLKTNLPSKNHSDNSKNLIELTINKLFKLSEIDEFIHEVIDNKDMADIVRGMCFYPSTSGVKLIFNYNSFVKKDQPQQQQHQYQQKQVAPVEFKPKTEKKFKYVPKKGIKKVYANLELKPTDEIDVYRLFCMEPVIKDGKTLYRRKFMSIAFIKDKDDTKKCQSLTKNNKSVIVKCLFNKDVNKWVPIEKVDDVDKPDLLEVIEEQMDTIEVSDTDDDD